MAKHLTDAEFTSAVAEGLSVVDFWAPWCGPCRMQSPVIDALSEELEGEVAFYKVNVDEEQQHAAEYRVMTIPTLLIMKDGQLLERLDRYHDKKSLEAVLNKYR